MQSWFSKVVAVAVMVFALSACTQASDGDSTSTDAPTGTSATTAAKQDEGEVINVNTALLGQGFKQESISAIYKDAAYWLMPFQTPLEMSRNPKRGNVSCMFKIVRQDYKQGAFASHPIKERSSVRLTGYVLDSEGEYGASLPKSPVVKFSDLTPAWLAGADAEFGGLKVCGKLTIK